MMRTQPFFLVLALLALISASIAEAKNACAYLPHARHRITRFVENPTFAKLNPPDAKESEKKEELKPMAVYVLQSAEEEHEPLMLRVDLEDGIASGALVAQTNRTDCSEGGKKRECSEHEKAAYREKSMKDYEIIVDKMRRKAKIRKADYAKLEGMEVLPSGDVCMLAADLVDEDAAPAAPAGKSQGRPASK